MNAEDLELMTIDDISLELHQRKNQNFLLIYKDQLSKRYKFTINYCSDHKSGVELYNELKNFMKIFKEALEKG